MDKKGVFSYLIGDSYEIGKKQGQELSIIDGIEDILFKKDIQKNDEIDENIQLLKKYYPSLLDELKGVADYFKRKVSDMKFLDSAYLIAGGCSLAAISSKKTIDGKPYVLRTYDLGIEISDFRMCSTNVEGLLSHSGFSVNFFGRSEGMNNDGLCITFASCGFPIGNEIGMLKPKISGFNFMVIIRLLLETCCSTEEALDLLKTVPIASNMNLLITDSFENTAIVETIDGNIYIKNSKNSATVLTNHPVIEEAKEAQNSYLNNSLIRYEILNDKLKNQKTVKLEEIKSLLKTNYPKGVSMLDYDDYFGTVQTILFDIKDKTVNFSFGSLAYNEEFKLKVGENLKMLPQDLCLPNKVYGNDFWGMKAFW